jgi:hypothetical protein
MLVLTGVLLGAVLVVMTGGTARTLQDIGWISRTPLGIGFPDWWARWLELVPTWETIALQVLAGAFVIGSYYAAEWWAREQRRRRRESRQTIEVAAARVRGTATGAPATPRIERPAVPAQVRATAYAAMPGAVPTTICGHTAMCLCGAPATTAIAAATSLARANLAPATNDATLLPAATAALPTPAAHAIAPTFVPVPLPVFGDAPRSNRIDDRAPLFTTPER